MIKILDAIDIVIFITVLAKNSLKSCRFVVSFANNPLSLENDSKGSIFHPLRVLVVFIRLCKSLIYEALFVFGWQFTGNCGVNVTTGQRKNLRDFVFKHII